MLEFALNYLQADDEVGRSCGALPSQLFLLKSHWLILYYDHNNKAASTSERLLEGVCICLSRQQMLSISSQLFQLLIVKDKTL